MNRRWLTAAVLVVGALAACTAPPCNAKSCDTGCCDALGECQPGSSRLACGDEGARCSVCATGQVCRQRQCAAQAVIDAGLADGGQPCRCPQGCCAADGACQPGNLNGACGTALDFCVACGATERCSAGRCVAAACASCLDPIGNCRDGGEASACGTGGALCRGCLADEDCVGGACRPKVCNPLACSGCCSDAGTCVFVVSDNECGARGSPCLACAGASCTGGVCR